MPLKELYHTLQFVLFSRVGLELFGIKIEALISFRWGKVGLAKLQVPWTETSCISDVWEAESLQSTRAMQTIDICIAIQPDLEDKQQLLFSESLILVGITLVQVKQLFSKV